MRVLRPPADAPAQARPALAGSSSAGPGRLCQALAAQSAFDESPRRDMPSAARAAGAGRHRLRQGGPRGRVPPARRPAGPGTRACAASGGAAAPAPSRGGTGPDPARAEGDGRAWLVAAMARPARPRMRAPLIRVAHPSRSSESLLIRVAHPSRC